MILTVEIEAEVEGQAFPEVGRGWVLNIVGYSKNMKSGKRLLIRCPRCKNGTLCPHDLSIDSENRPTLKPLYGCKQCGFHSYLRNGVHEQLSDFK